MCVVDLKPGHEPDQEMCCHEQQNKFHWVEIGKKAPHKHFKSKMGETSISSLDASKRHHGIQVLSGLEL